MLVTWFFSPCYRAHYYDGPTQYIHVIPGHIYRVSAWIKVLNDHAGQNVDAAIDFQFTGQYCYCIAKKTGSGPSLMAAGHIKTSMSTFRQQKVSYKLQRLMWNHTDTAKRLLSTLGRRYYYHLYTHTLTHTHTHTHKRAQT